MSMKLDNKIKELVSNFHLLRTKEGTQQFDAMWKECMEGLSAEERKEAGSLLRQEMQNRRKAVQRIDNAVRSQTGELFDIVSMTYIAKEYFNKDRSWLAQRINGNIVNGKPCTFTEDELSLFKFAVNDIKNKLSDILLNIK